MYKKTRDFNSAECMIWMYKFNPNKVNIEMDEDYPIHLIFLVPADQLQFPEGWYYSEDTKTLKNENGSKTIYVEIKE